MAQHNEVKALADMLAAAAAQHAKELRAVKEESTRQHEAYVEKTSKVGWGGVCGPACLPGWLLSECYCCMLSKEQTLGLGRCSVDGNAGACTSNN